jgi:hypothetical protein
MGRPARRSGVPPPAGSPLVAPAGRSWQGLDYRVAEPGARAVRDLFRFAGAHAPAPAPAELAWEAREAARLVGGVLAERDGDAAFVHGPVVVDPPPGQDALEVAAQLVAALIDHADQAGLNRLYTRPQGLDRVWVRAGCVPVPESTLPPGLRDRPGVGLHAWRRPGTYEIATPDPDGSRRRGRR